LQNRCRDGIIFRKEVVMKRTTASFGKMVGLSGALAGLCTAAWAGGAATVVGDGGQGCVRDRFTLSDGVREDAAMKTDLGL
jgi:hypothetical protein